MKARSAMLGSLLILSLILALSPTGAALASPHGCRDVMFIGARGSGEPLQVKKNGQMVTVFHGVGKPIDYMAGLLEQDVKNYGEEMGILPVIYNADSVEELKPSKTELAEMATAGLGGVAGLTGAAGIYYERNLKPYEASIAGGVSATIDEIHAVLSGCPETEIVLAATRREPWRSIRPS